MVESEAGYLGPNVKAVSHGIRAYRHPSRENELLSKDQRSFTSKHMTIDFVFFILISVTHTGTLLHCHLEITGILFHGQTHTVQVCTHVLVTELDCDWMCAHQVCTPSHLVYSRPDDSCLQQLLDFFRAEIGDPNAPDQALVDQLLHG